MRLGAHHAPFRCDGIWGKEKANDPSIKRQNYHTWRLYFFTCLLPAAGRTHRRTADNMKSGCGAFQRFLVHQTTRHPCRIDGPHICDAGKRLDPSAHTPRCGQNLAGFIQQRLLWSGWSSPGHHIHASVQFRQHLRRCQRQCVLQFWKIRLQTVHPALSKAYLGAAIQTGSLVRQGFYF